MNKAKTLFAAAVFLLCAAVHIATFFPAMDGHYGWTWALTLAVFASFILMFRSIKAFNEQPQTAAFRNPVQWFGDNLRVSQRFYTPLVRSVPALAVLLCAAMMFYCVLNFGLMFVHTGGYTAEGTPGHYFLSDHGKLVRSLTTYEYGRMKAYEVRGFTGHWMLFSLIAFLGLSFVAPAEQENTPPL